MAPHSNGGAKKEGKNPPLDDTYMMYSYKVIPCSRVSTHNWKLCHFSHVGEVAARRRHPSCHSADLCAYVSANKECLLGDSCPYAHNAFESWLHPDRYKTTLCSYAGSCTRKFCFFAHAASELRTPGKSVGPSDLSCRVTKPGGVLDSANSIGTPSSATSTNSTVQHSALQQAWAAAAAAQGLLGAQGMGGSPAMGPAGGLSISVTGSSLLSQAALALQQQQLLGLGLAPAQLAALLAGQGLAGLDLLQQQQQQQGSGLASLGGIATSAAATGGSGPVPMQCSWDLSPLGSLLASTGSGGTPMGTDASGAGPFGAAHTRSPTTPSLTASGTPTAAAAAAAKGGGLQSQMSGFSSPLLHGMQALGGGGSSAGCQGQMQLALNAAMGASNAMAAAAAAAANQQQQQQHQEAQLRQLLLQQHMAAALQQHQQQQQHMALQQLMAGTGADSQGRCLSSVPTTAGSLAPLGGGSLSLEQQQQQQLAQLLLKQHSLTDSMLSSSPGTPDLSMLAAQQQQQQLSAYAATQQRSLKTGASSLGMPPHTAASAGAAAAPGSSGSPAAPAGQRDNGMLGASAAGSPAQQQQQHGLMGSQGASGSGKAGSGSSTSSSSGTSGMPTTLQLQQQLDLLGFAAMVPTA